MTAHAIARRAGARPTSRGWIGRCPSHADARPSLSIREGRDGRTLLKCFAGCEPAAIAQALGLRLSDLFAGPMRLKSPSAESIRVVTADDVEASLQSELARIVADESARLGFPIAVLARHRNAARPIVERRLSVSLKRELSPWWEVEPHCVDPAWTLCIDQALHVVAACGDVTIGTLLSSIHDLKNTRECVLQYARLLQRTLTKEPASSWLCAA
jgi:hypothetical protein